MIITNFFFNSPHYYFDKSSSSKSVTDKTSFRPNSQIVRENLASKTKLNHKYDYPDGDYKDKPDFSVLHGFPDRTEINSIVSTLENDIENRVEKDLKKSELENLSKLDKDYKEAVIKSLSDKQVDSSSVVSDS